MVTKIFFHPATSVQAGTLPTASQSTSTAGVSPFDAQTVNRYMNTTIGTSQTTLTCTSTTFTALELVYITRFVSDILDSSTTTISANTWTYEAGFSDVVSSGDWPGGSSSAHAFPCTLYVWRPSTGAKIGTIFDGNSASTTAFIKNTTQRGVKVTFTGSGVTAATGDVLIFEAWGLSSAVSGQQYRYGFDGTTTGITDNTAQASMASSIATPQSLVFTPPPSTHLYLHKTTSTVSGTLPTASQSTFSTAGDNLTAQTVNNSMDTTIGTSQTSIGKTITGPITLYISKFVSKPLASGSSTITAQTWNYGAAYVGLIYGPGWPYGDNSPKKFPCTLYVWRPSTGANIGTIFDGNSSTNTALIPDGTNEAACVVSFTGSGVTGAVGDVLIFEAWGLSGNVGGNPLDTEFYLDGTDDTFLDAALTTNCAAYIQTPQILTFGIPSVACTVTGKSIIPNKLWT